MSDDAKAGRTTAPAPLPPLEQRRNLYAARRYLPRATTDRLGLRLTVPVYFKDPFVAAHELDLGIDKAFTVPWEPGLGDGPTSARFAVVDYDAETGKIAPPARWDRKANAFRGAGGETLDEQAIALPQFQQVSTWAVVQHTLEFFEDGFALGRPIPWGFEGNRLIIVPHAGYGQNAYYDRKSKSLQLYYFRGGEETIYTCLSTDIVAHEFGHAVLDGLRPYYLEAVTPQTAAFHEFMGDLTALLSVFRNNEFRRRIGERTQGNLEGSWEISDLAAQFGAAVSEHPYLRTARNKTTLAELGPEMEPHKGSEVLTGAVFDILLKVSEQYRKREKKISVADALYYTAERMRRMTIQPLDLLPPVEVTFRDYAIAMLRAELVANPTDPHGYRAMIVDAFIARGVLDAEECDALLKSDYVFRRLPMRVYHDPAQIAGSRTAAYRFLDDNREDLMIPRGVDLVVADVFTAEKRDRQGEPLPRQIIVQYVWREDVLLEGERFGRYAGRPTSMLCGGTIVLDQNGRLVAWARKPGSTPTGTDDDAKADAEEGKRRREAFLDALARRIARGTVGDALGGAAGLLGDSMRLLTANEVDGSLRFELTPHLSIRGHGDHEDEGDQPWSLSS